MSHFPRSDDIDRNMPSCEYPRDIQGALLSTLCAMEDRDQVALSCSRETSMRRLCSQRTASSMTVGGCVSAEDNKTLLAAERNLRRACSPGRLTTLLTCSAHRPRMMITTRKPSAEFGVLPGHRGGPNKSFWSEILIFHRVVYA